MVGIIGVLSKKNLNFLPHFFGIPSLNVPNVFPLRRLTFHKGRDNAKMLVKSFFYIILVTHSAQDSELLHLPAFRLQMYKTN